MQWPHKFKLQMPPRYNGATDPLAFLVAYVEAVLKAGGNGRIMANWFPMALTGVPRMWLLHLPTASVTSWGELRDLFLAHYAAPVPPVVATLLGGSQAPPLSRHVKPFTARSAQPPSAEKPPRLGGARGRSDLQLGQSPLQTR